MPERPRRDPRDRLRIPVAAVIIVLELVSGVVALWREEIQVFLIATGPFTMLCAYLFTDRMLSQVRNGKDRDVGP